MHRTAEKVRHIDAFCPQANPPYPSVATWQRVWASLSSVAQFSRCGGTALLPEWHSYPTAVALQCYPSGSAFPLSSIWKVHVIRCLQKRKSIGNSLRICNKANYTICRKFWFHLQRKPYKLFFFDNDFVPFWRKNRKKFGGERKCTYFCGIKLHYNQHFIST